MWHGKMAVARRGQYRDVWGKEASHSYKKNVGGET